MIDVFRAEDPPERERLRSFVEFAIVEGDPYSLTVVLMTAGEQPPHEHADEHVGVVLEGGFSFFDEATETSLASGDVYRIQSGTRHGIRCVDRAVVIQAGAGRPPNAGTSP